MFCSSLFFKLGCKVMDIIMAFSQISTFVELYPLLISFCRVPLYWSPSWSRIPYSDFKSCEFCCPLCCHLSLKIAFFFSQHLFSRFIIYFTHTHVYCKKEYLRSYERKYAICLSGSGLYLIT